MGRLWKVRRSTVVHRSLEEVDTDLLSAPVGEDSPMFVVLEIVLAVGIVAVDLALVGNDLARVQGVVATPRAGGGPGWPTNSSARWRFVR